MAQNDCEFWGENRADEYFFDVGCVCQHTLCDPAKCHDYRPIKRNQQ